MAVSTSGVGLSEAEFFVVRIDGDRTHGLLIRLRGGGQWIENSRGKGGPVVSIGGGGVHETAFVRLLRTKVIQKKTFALTVQDALAGFVLKAEFSRLRLGQASELKERSHTAIEVVAGVRRANFVGCGAESVEAERKRDQDSQV
jgi:hypothetical protein